MQSRSITVHVTSLQMARGHDGFLRGKPEPVLLVGVYAAAGGVLLLLERHVVRFERPTSSYPQTVAPRTKTSTDSVVVSGDDVRLVALVFALEEDGGADIQRAFGALERPDTLTVWDVDSHDVAPLHLRECLPIREFTLPRRVHVMFDAREAGVSCTSDKWVGAALCVIPPRGVAAAMRFPFLAADELNDWTAIVSVQF